MARPNKPKSLKSLYQAEYSALKNAVHRCHNEDHQAYHNYGGRKDHPIHVCPKWRTPNGFALFLNHIGPRSSPEHSLDRIDNDLGYEEGNVWWAPSRAVQQANRRKNKQFNVQDFGWGIGRSKSNKSGKGHGSPLIPHDGRTQTLVDWCEELGMKHATVRQRLERGVSPDEALNPILHRRHRRTLRPEMYVTELQTQAPATSEQEIEPMNDQNITSLLQHIIDKLNRIEANVARIKQDPTALQDAIDTAIAKLEVQLEPTRH